MRRLIAAALLAGGLTILAGCGDKPGAGGLTEEDNLQLNNAAEMLDTSPDSLVANDEAVLGNGDEDVPADENEAAGNDSGNEVVD
jgi:hypothetical protein